MPTPPEWYQQTLTQPDALELNLRVGIIPETDHAQVLVELKDPLTGVLLAQASMHHFRIHRLREVVDAYVQKGYGWVEDSVEPF